MKLPPLVIAHAGCPDGTCAAWVVKRAYPTADVHWARHGSPPPDVVARDVVMVDFTYAAETMGRLARECRSMVVLDHHATAHERVAWIRDLPDVFVEVDESRSGAGIAHDRFNLASRPWIVSYVEDRDLWRNELFATREVNAILGTLPLDDVAAWEHFYAQHPTAKELVEPGRWIRRAVGAYVRETAKTAIARRVFGLSADSLVVTAPFWRVDELLVHLAAESPSGVAVGWRQTDGGFTYSLRSLPGGPDVSEIAARFGGGGHVHAAGFQATELVHENSRDRAVNAGHCTDRGR